jgi:hypothetical protein
MFAGSVKVLVDMGEFAILTNRRRAIVALVHSVIFLLIAARQMQVSAPAAGIWIPSAVTSGTWVLCTIYCIVSVILAWLLMISRAWIEKVYFALCTVSAASGLLRTVVGDHAFHAGLYIRVIMLCTAVFVGMAIVRTHSDFGARSPKFVAGAEAADSE